MSKILSRLWRFLGRRQQKAGRSADARKYLERAIAADPQDYAPYWDMALLLGPGEDTEKILRQAVAANPQMAAAWHGLGDLLLAVENFPEAEAAFRQAVKLDVGAAQSWNLLALAIAEQSGRDNEAEQHYRRALEADPGLAGAWSNLGNLLQDRLGNYPEAEACYRRAVALDPGNAPAWNGLGNVLARVGRPEEAFTAFRQAIELAPADPLPQSNLIRLVAAHLPARDLIREPTPAEAETLDEFRFKAGGDANLVSLTLFGDLFLAKEDGIHFLAIHYGQLGRICGSAAELQEKLDGGELDPHLRRPVVAELKIRGRRPLEPSELYGFRVSPRLGGQETVANVEPEPGVLLLSRAADLLRQTDGLPPGTRVRVEVDWQGFLEKVSEPS